MKRIIFVLTLLLACFGAVADTIFYEGGVEKFRLKVASGLLKTVDAAGNLMWSVTDSGTTSIFTVNGTYVGTWAGTALTDAQVSDTLTASIFKGSGSSTDAVDLETAEVAGTLPAASVGNGLTDAQVVNDLTINSLHSITSISTSTPAVSGTVSGSATNTISWAADATHLTTADMVDGFGSGIQFRSIDSAVVSRPYGGVGAVRDGADGEGAWVAYAGTDGVEEVARIDHSGNMTLLGTIGDADVSDTLTIGSGSTITAPPAIGASTPNAGKFTTLEATTSLTVSNNYSYFGVNDTTDGALSVYGSATGYGGCVSLFNPGDFDDIVSRWWVHASDNDGYFRLEAIWPGETTSTSAITIATDLAMSLGVVDKTVTIPGALAVTQTANITGILTLGAASAVLPAAYMFGGSGNTTFGIGRNPTQRFDVFSGAASIANFETSLASGYSAVQVKADGANNKLDMIEYGSTMTGTIFGLARANASTLYAYGSPLYVGTNGAYSVVLGTNDTTRMTIDSTGFVALSSYLTTVGGVHVGGTSDPGTDNLIVDGSVRIAGPLATTTITTFTADDTSPSVAAGNIFQVPATWTAGHNITTFDDGVVGQTIVIHGGDSDCVVVDGDTLHLAGNWTAAAYATLVLQCFATGNWVELCRSAPG